MRKRLLQIIEHTYFSTSLQIIVLLHIWGLTFYGLDIDAAVDVLNIVVLMIYTVEIIVKIFVYRDAVRLSRFVANL